nr:MAG TPA: hypothetical protein [Caudoviricetes sp.]
MYISGRTISARSLIAYFKGDHLQSDRQQTCPELGITFPCAALRYSHAKLSGSRQAERMDSNHQDLVYDQAVPSYLHIPQNPDCTGLAIGLSCYAFH